MDIVEFEKLLEEAFERIGQPELRACIAQRRVPIRIEMREWEYGEEGECYPCFIGVEDRAANTVIGYCQSGFGPSYPWGLLFRKGKFTSLGPDSCWYASLEDAVRESQFWTGENPDGYEAQ